MKKSDQLPAVIYARYSSHMQREESIAGQLRECHEYARKNNMQVIQEYADKAMTGRTDARPAFLQMIKDSESKKFQYVICWKMDRFSRDRYDSALYKMILKKNGVKVVYAKESIPDGPEGVILESLMEGLAQYYSENLAQNIKRGLTDSALACKALAVPPFGYRKTADGFLELDPVAAPAVAKIFKDYADGVPAVEIIEELNGAGFKNNCGRPFGKSSIKRIIKNERYMGIYIWNDVRIEGGIPAIVDREMWESAQKMADRHHIAPAAKRDVHFLLTTKIRCARCGEFMTGESCRSKSGKIHYYYTCFGRRKASGCDAPRLRKEETESFVCEVLSGLSKSPAFLEEVADAVMDYIARQNADTGKIDALRSLLKDASKKHKNIMRAIEMGVITESTKSRLLELEEEISRLEVSIAREEAKRPAITRDHVLYFLENMTPSSRRNYNEQLVDIFLNCAYIYDDHVDFLLNYTKNAEPVTFTSYCSALDLAENCSPLGRLVDQTSRKANIVVFDRFFLLRLAI